jgi:deoxyribodipyrimidine photolyase-related protein
MKTVRLIFGDQLNSNHSWYETVDDSITYVLMEIRTETDYVASYPKFSVFSAMRAFAIDSKSKKHV